jgi:hypothetical protein
MNKSAKCTFSCVFAIVAQWLVTAFFLAKFRQNVKKINFKRIFCHGFFENLKNNRQKSRGFELVSPDLEALLLWVAK